MTTDDIPRVLDGPRIYPDRPMVKIELNCICGRTLESTCYLDSGLIKLVVERCTCGGGK